jgi:hypothetical protein
MKAKMTVRYTSGREDSFEVDLFGGDSAELRLKEFVKDPTVVLQTDNELIVIPSNSIERITFSLPQSGREGFQLGSVRIAKRLR